MAAKNNGGPNGEPLFGPSTRTFKSDNARNPEGETECSNSKPRFLQKAQDSVSNSRSLFFNSDYIASFIKPMTGQEETDILPFTRAFDIFIISLLHVYRYSNR